MRFGYTDVAGCVRVVDLQIDERGVRIERDVLTRQGRKEWGRRVEAVRKHAERTMHDEL